MTAHVLHAAEMPAGTFLENVAVARDGAVLVADDTGRHILRHRSGRGALLPWAELGACPFDMVVLGDGAVIVDVHGKAMFEGGPGGRAFRRVEPDGRSRMFADAPRAGSLNRLARLSPGACVATASRSGTPWRFDLATREVTRWLDHELFGPGEEEAPHPAPNGIKPFRGGLLRVESTAPAAAARPGHAGRGSRRAGGGRPGPAPGRLRVRRAPRREPRGARGPLGAAGCPSGAGRGAGRGRRGPHGGGVRAHAGLRRHLPLRRRRRRDDRVGTGRAGAPRAARRGRNRPMAAGAWPACARGRAR